MTASKPQGVWVPSLSVGRQGFRITLASPETSVAYDVSTRDLVRFYFQLRQALSGSSAKTRANAKPKELTDDNSREILDT